MRIRCKAFDVTLKYVNDKTFIICHSIARDQVGVLYFNPVGSAYPVGSRQSLELSLHMTYLCGNVDSRNFNKMISDEESYEVYEKRLHGLQEAAKHFGIIATKKDHYPDFF